MLGFIIVAGLWGVGNFGQFLSFGPTAGTSTPAAETYYLLVAGTTDNLTTPTGDKIVLAGH